MLYLHFTKLHYWHLLYHTPYIRFSTDSHCKLYRIYSIRVIKMQIFRRWPRFQKNFTTNRRRNSIDSLSNELRIRSFVKFILKRVIQKCLFKLL